MSFDLPAQQDLIDGSICAPAGVREEWIEDPNTGERVQQQTVTDPEEIETALQAAWRVHTSREWSGRSVEERAATLMAVADALEPRCGRIAELESATSGATISTTSMLSFIVHAAFRLAAVQISEGVLSTRFEGPTGRDVEVDRLPWGPALLLCPWNAPAPMAAHKAASALAAGAPVIIKPPERAPHGTEALAAATLEVDLPDGLVQVVHGGPEVGAALVADPRIRAVSFTGGTEGGRAIAHQCAEGLKPAQLELGGHSPVVVMPDAEPALVAEGIVALLTTLNGQWCRALGRVIVPAELASDVLDATLAALAGVRLGSSLDPASTMGPIVHSSHLAMLRGRLDQLAGLGGTLHAPTPLPDGPLTGGNWLAPTLVTGVDPTHTRTEIFGPVATVHTYERLEEAVELANGTDYGLEAYVFGTDEDEAMSLARQVIAGGVKVNGASPISLHLMAPRPAWGISGLHDEGTVETIHFFGGNRVVGVEGSLGATAENHGQPTEG